MVGGGREREMGVGGGVFLPAESPPPPGGGSPPSPPGSEVQNRRPESRRKGREEAPMYPVRVVFEWQCAQEDPLLHQLHLQIFFP